MDLALNWNQWWGLLHDHKDGRSAFCQSTNYFSDGEQTSTMTVRGPRNMYIFSTSLKVCHLRVLSAICVYWAHGVLDQRAVCVTPIMCVSLSACQLSSCVLATAWGPCIAHCLYTVYLHWQHMSHSDSSCIPLVHRNLLQGAVECGQRCLSGRHH